jgi:hypothetical protein
VAPRETQLLLSSSRGGTPILFDRSGALLPTDELCMQPRFVATNGCINTFFGKFDNIAPKWTGFLFVWYVPSLLLSFVPYVSPLLTSLALLDDSLVSKEPLLLHPMQGRWLL